METDSFNQTETAESDVHESSPHERISQAMSRLKAAGDKGASWFLYIAILSLVNTAVIHFGANRQFAIGLAITLVVDAVANVIGKQNPQVATTAMIIAICFSVFVSGMAILFGSLSRKRYHWIFGLGMFLYLLDGLLYLLVHDFMSAAFHAYVIYGMYRGLRAYQQLRRLEDAVEQATLDDPASSSFQPAPQFETL